VADLTNIKDRLCRVDDHIDALKQILRDYFASNPYRIRGEYHRGEEEAEMLYETLGFTPPPPRLYTITGEVLYGLRSTLDHLAWILVETGEGKPDKDTCWPILQVPPTPNKKGISPPPHVSGAVPGCAALALIEASQPYKWEGMFANHELFILNELCNIDKHRHVAVKGVWLTNMYFAGPGLGLPDFAWHAELASSDEHGARILLTADKPNVDVQGDATLQILLHESGPLPHTALLLTIEAMVRAVKEIMKQAEPLCT